jgi:predicted dithiol-disulfide oxidoreductase (DUF899 family)
VRLRLAGWLRLRSNDSFFNPTEIIKPTKQDKMKIETLETKTDESEVDPSKVVSEAEWLVARKDLLTREKELTRLRDEVSRHRRELPWVKVKKQYVFDGPNGQETLKDLFDGSSQLIVYHFMFGPEWDEGCKSCSYLADHFDGADWHLPHRDVSFAVISRAPLPKLDAYKKRMGWRFKWLSSYGNDFNFDYHVSFTKEDEKKNEAYYNYAKGEFTTDELPGLSVFYRDKNGAVFHTYSTYARGLDLLVGAYNFLDLVPEGRDEDHLDFSMEWVRRHDEY